MNYDISLLSSSVAMSRNFFWWCFCWGDVPLGSGKLIAPSSPVATFRSFLTGQLHSFLPNINDSRALLILGPSIEDDPLN